MIYTGIGSRNTPEHILEQMSLFAFNMTLNGHILRSGGASGADAAFQYGMQECCKTWNKDPFKLSEIYVPWRGFSSESFLNKELNIVPSNMSAACGIAATIHPAWYRLKPGAKALHGRNVCQVLGDDFNTPSSFVLFYAEEVKGKVQGGTATAVNLARKMNIPCFNMLYPDWKEKLEVFVDL
jgi:hypothetical protein